MLIVDMTEAFSKTCICLKNQIFRKRYLEVPLSSYVWI